jgi:tetratricopeptide (TPR) repeat protein
MNDFKNLFLWSVFSVPVILSLFLLGGVYSHKETNLIIILISSLLSLLYFSYRFFKKRDIYISPVSFPLFLILFYSLIQMIPLPESILSLISPSGSFFRGIGGNPSGPLTMSIPDTFYSSMRVLLLIIFSTAVTTIIQSRNEKGKRTLYVTMILTSSWTILLAFMLRLLHADSWLYGTLYRHSFLMDPVIINPNHAAGYFGIASFFVLLMIYRTTSTRVRFFYGAVFFIHFIAVISTLSRGGIAAFLTALILFALMNRFTSGKFLKHKLVIFFAALSFATVLYSGHSFLANEFDFSKDDYFNKILNITDVFPYFKDFFLAGSGLGSFSKVFTYYQTNPETRFVQLENEPLQFILETGVPFAILIFITFIFIAFKRKDPTLHSAERNSLASMIYFVLAHNLMDFNLHNLLTLFLVVIAFSILLKPINFSGRKKFYTLAFCSVASLILISAVSINSLRSLTGYDEKYEYNKAVYYYPADYSIPFVEGINRINSSDNTIVFSAGSYISDAISKSPGYYYTYFVSGSYMLKIGSLSQALVFYKESAEKSDKKLSFILEKIYRQLNIGKNEDKIIEIIPYSEQNRDQIESFLRTIGYDNEVYSKIIERKKDLFFISNIRDLIRNNQYNEALLFIEKLENPEVEISEMEKGQLLVFKADIARNNKDFEKAFELYCKGGEITNNFNTYLAAARISLNLGEREISIIENKMKKLSFLSKSNMAGYQKWNSEKEFKLGSFAKGINHLNKAIALHPSPGWIFELYRHYYRNGMFFEAEKALKLLISHHPSYRKEQTENLLKEVSTKIKDKKTEAYKEKMLGR